MTADFKQSLNLAGKILASGQILTQTMTITGSPTGGTWTPYVNGVSAGTVAYNASAATLQTALRTVNASISVSGSAGGPYTVTVPIGVLVTLGANAFTGGTGPSVAVAGIDTTIYTVPASTAAKVSTAVLTNTSTQAVVVSVSAVPNGGTVDGSHRVVSAYSLAAGDSTKITELEASFFEAGALVSLNVAAAGAVNYLLTGAEAS